jgi:mannose-6-phosphate isomerase
MKLERRYVEKPWGSDKLPPMFEAPAGKRIGEVWFSGGAEQPLLLKYLFTSERLSIQVHPNDKQARALGLPRGKTECWYILDSGPDAKLGLGLRHEVTAEQLRAAALDGSIEELIDWRSVRAGDFFLVPPGTIHAIGGGISLIEFQQNSDVTYRLYDYGRPRALHLDEAVSVARREPYPHTLAQHLTAGDCRILVDAPPFALAYSDRDLFEDRQRWIIPLAGEVRANGQSGGPGDCLLAAPGERVEVNSARMLVGASA